MKPVFAVNTMIADFIRAQAGAPDAQFDVVLSALYSAYYHVLKSGNKTQFNLVQTACDTYKDVKACKALFNAERITPAVKQAHAVYLAYGAALAQVGVPAVMKGADHAAIDDAAAILATEFATSVTIALTPEVKAPKTEAEKAQAKADKEVKAAQAKAELDASIKAEAEKIASASVVTLADMVRIVANAARTGMLDADSLTMLDGALDAVAATVSFVPVAGDVAELAHA